MKMKKLVADLSLDREMLKAVIAKNGFQHYFLNRGVVCCGRHWYCSTCG